MMWIVVVCSLTGFGPVADRQAEAGIVISGDPGADQRARDNGFAYSVEGGGNVGWIAVDSELGVTYSSLVFVNPFTAISDQHKFDAKFGINQTYTVGIGANYNSGPTFTPSQIIKHPDYLGTPGQGVDLTVLKFDVPVPVQKDLVFATSKPALNETVWMAGYGKRGNPVDGYRDQDGAIGKLKNELSVIVRLAPRITTAARHAIASQFADAARKLPSLLPISD